MPLIWSVGRFGVMSRPLHAVFSELLDDEAMRQAYGADPASLLEAAGHPDLPADLVNEAVASYTDTAPPALAEHLAPFVMAHSPFSGAADPAELDGLALLATAAPMEATGVELDTDLPEPPEAAVATHAEAGPPGDFLDFGSGSEFEPSRPETGTFDDALTEIPAAHSEPEQTPSMGDDALLAPDPTLAVDDAEPEDLDTE
jgi:hypothetical protein